MSPKCSSDRVLGKPCGRRPTDFFQLRDHPAITHAFCQEHCPPERQSSWTGYLTRVSEEEFAILEVLNS